MKGLGTSESCSAKVCEFRPDAAAKEQADGDARSSCSKRTIRILIFLVHFHAEPVARQPVCVRAIAPGMADVLLCDEDGYGITGSVEAPKILIIIDTVQSPLHEQGFAIVMRPNGHIEKLALGLCCRILSSIMHPCAHIAAELA